MKGTDEYPHMPILYPHATRHIVNVFHERCISSVKFTTAHLYGNVYMWVVVARALANSFDFGLLGEQSYVVLLVYTGSSTGWFFGS